MWIWNILPLGTPSGNIKKETVADCSAQIERLKATQRLHQFHLHCWIFWQTNNLKHSIIIIKFYTGDLKGQTQCQALIEWPFICSSQPCSQCLWVTDCGQQKVVRLTDHHHTAPPPPPARYLHTARPAPPSITDWNNKPDQHHSPVSCHAIHTGLGTHTTLCKHTWTQTFDYCSGIENTANYSCCIDSFNCYTIRRCSSL